ncbi:MAG: hypothetical protein HY606_07005, partial [Planctomycetes bacterium]|nr:hypothetical protein [Planctomycetota bacterium]
MGNNIRSELMNHAGLVFSIAFKILKNKDDAEDVLQDTYLSIINRLNEGVKISNLKAYLARTSYTKSLDMKKRINNQKLTALQKTCQDMKINSYQ